MYHIPDLPVRGDYSTLPIFCQITFLQVEAGSVTGHRAEGIEKCPAFWVSFSCRLYFVHIGAVCAASLE